jgi:hypothetical protein
MMMMMLNTSRSVYREHNESGQARASVGGRLYPRGSVLQPLPVSKEGHTLTAGI